MHQAGGAFGHHRTQGRVAAPLGQNHLLAVLPSVQLEALLRHLEPVYLERGTCLYETGQPLGHVYFLTRGIVSLGCAATNGDTTELALVGPEGVIGVEAFLGSDESGHRAVARTLCTGYSLRVSVARARFAEGGALQQALLKYARGLLLDISQTSICNLHHSLEQRLCRSLLQGVDRIGSNTLPMTQDVLADVVGAWRQGVSETVQKLRDRRLISCGRGSITVLDRAGLLARACECYVAVRLQTQRLQG